MDETQAQFYNFLAENCTEEEKSTFILSEKCMENVNIIIKSYDDKGFKKKRIQDGMEFVDARKPFENAKFGTLREKHNTYMNFILTLNSKQKEKRLIEKIEMEKIEEEKRQILQREEDERLADILKDIANSIMPCIQMEADWPSKNNDRRLPILDMKVWNDENGKIMYTHYEKPMASKM